MTNNYDFSQGYPNAVTKTDSITSSAVIYGAPDPGTSAPVAFTQIAIKTFVVDSLSGLLKANGSGVISAASAGTDYLTSVNNANWSGTQLAVANGGTGLTALGTAYQIPAVNVGATALAYAGLSSLIDQLGSASQGQIAYRGASAWGLLAAGTAGNLLLTGGAGANPSWWTAGVASNSGSNLTITGQSAGDIPLALANTQTSSTVISPLLSATQTWNAAVISVTSASGTGSVITLNFSAQSAAFPVGATVATAGFSGGSGTWNITGTVLASPAPTTTSCAISASGTGSPTLGTVQASPVSLFLNVTSTDSAYTSRLIDLQVGGSSKFSVDKNGNSTLGGGFTINGALSVVATGIYVYNNGGNIAFGSNADAIVIRDNAGVIAVRKSGSQQVFRVYNTYSSSTTGDYFAIDWQNLGAANTCLVGPQKLSSGTLRSAVYTHGTALTYATLPTGSDGMKAFISDSNVAASTNFGASISSGGGTNHVPLYYDGGASTWRIG